MTKTKKFLNLSTVFVIAFVVAMTAFVSQAKAESPNVLTGSDLTVGSSGQDVVVLQGLLSEMGYLVVPPGVSLGYFGGLTRNALGRYQSDLSVSPPAGYFGPKTKVAMHQNFAQHNWLTLLGW